MSFRGVLTELRIDQSEGRGYRPIMFAKISRAEPSAMTSGRANIDKWYLEYQSTERSRIDPLTGNTSNRDTREQLKMRFDSLDDAVAYAKSKGIPHRVIDKPKSKRISRSYSENFDYDRKLPWTH